VDKTTDQQPKVQQFEAGKDLGLENFLLKFLELIIHHEVPILKLFSQQDLVDKATPQIQGSAVRVHRVPGSAETSGSY